MNGANHFLMVLVYAGLGAGAAWAAQGLFGLDWVIASTVGAVLFLALCQFHMAVSRARRAKQVEERVDAIAGVQRDTNERMDVVEARTEAVEMTVKHELGERRDALVSEMKQLEGLIERLTASFEAKLVATSAAPGATTADAAQVSPMEDRVLRTVLEALESHRVDMHLQPIVSLPDRRVRFYESFSRLRHEDGSLILPAEFMDAARRANLLGTIDSWTLYRSVQIVRRLAERDRRVGVFCNISPASLEDDHVFPSFLQFMRENQDLSGAVIFEIDADRFESRSRRMRENMNRLVALGFRFSIDHVESLAIDLPRLQDAGIRFIKISGDKLVRDFSPGGARPISAVNRELAPDDVSAVFDRYGVSIVADRVEDEASVAEIIDCGVPYGQGHIFGTPRPIKASLMEETRPPEDFVPRVRNVN